MRGSLLYNLSFSPSPLSVYSLLNLIRSTPQSLISVT